MQVNAISGRLSPGWTLPSPLKFLLLGANNLTGPLPPLVLPDAFEGLTLAYNQLSSTLPHTWVLPHTTQWVALDNNRLEGPVRNWTLPFKFK